MRGCGGADDVVCGIQRTYRSDETDGLVHKVIPIAGDLNKGGSDLDFEASRLQPSPDSDREGLRLTLRGGAYPSEGPNKRKQSAVIDFICDAKLEGTENEWAAGGAYEGARVRRDGLVKREEGEEQLVKEGAALKFLSYGRESGSDVETLRLEWKTKYVCAEASEGKSASWGFFTWLLIMYVPLPPSYPCSR